MIAEAFTAEAEAIVFPSRSDFAEAADFTAAYQSYGEAQAELNDRFALALAAEYLSEIAEAHVEAVAGATFGLAWEHGHSSGYSEIENYYTDFAGFATTVYAAAAS